MLGSPTIAPNGSITCTPFAAQPRWSQELRSYASAHDVAVQWSVTDATAMFTNISTPAGAAAAAARRAVFLAGLPAAVQRCDVDGIEFDYEPGTSETSAEAAAYTAFLAAIQRTMGAGFAVSADIAAWTDAPYVIAAALPSPIFVNLMSYFFSASGAIDEYIAACATVKGWGFPNAQVNVGIPFYDSAQGAWADLAPECPHIAVENNT